MEGVEPGPSHGAHYCHCLGQAKVIHAEQLNPVPVLQQQVVRRIARQGLVHIEALEAGGPIQGLVHHFAAGPISVRQHLGFTLEQVRHPHAVLAGVGARHPRPARQLHHGAGALALGERREQVPTLQGGPTRRFQRHVLAALDARGLPASQGQGPGARFRGKAPGKAQGVGRGLTGPELELHRGRHAGLLPAAEPLGPGLVGLSSGKGPVGLGIQADALVPGRVALEDQELPLQEGHPVFQGGALRRAQGRDRCDRESGGRVQHPRGLGWGQELGLNALEFPLKTFQLVLHGIEFESFRSTFTLVRQSCHLPRHPLEGSLQLHLVLRQGHEDCVATLQGHVGIAQALSPQGIEIQPEDLLATAHDADVAVAAHGRGTAGQAQQVHQGTEAGYQVAAGLVDLAHDEDAHLAQLDHLQVHRGPREVAAHQTLHGCLGLAQTEPAHLGGAHLGDDDLAPAIHLQGQVEGGAAEDVEVQAVAGAQYVVLSDAPFRGRRAGLPHLEQVRSKAAGPLLPGLHGLDLFVQLVVLATQPGALIRCGGRTRSGLRRHSIRCPRPLGGSSLLQRLEVQTLGQLGQDRQTGEQQSHTHHQPHHWFLMQGTSVHWIITSQGGLGNPRSRWSV